MDGSDQKLREKSSRADVHKVRGQDGRTHYAIWYSKRTVCRHPHFLTIEPDLDAEVCGACVLLVEEREA
jgi:hypothetical protein